MSSERQILKRLLEGNYEDNERDEELEEASFENGGHVYKCAFGKYSCDGEPISREDYFKAKDGGSVGTDSKVSDEYSEGEGPVDLSDAFDTSEIWDLTGDDGGIFDDDDRKMIEDHCRKVGFDPKKSKCFDDTNNNNAEDLSFTIGGNWKNSPVEMIPYSKGGYFSVGSFESDDGYVATVITSRDAYQVTLVSRKENAKSVNKSKKPNSSNTTKVGGVKLSTSNIRKVSSAPNENIYELDKEYTEEKFVKDMEAAGYEEDDGAYVHPETDYYFYYDKEDDTPRLYVGR